MCIYITEYGHLICYRDANGTTAERNFPSTNLVPHLHGNVAGPNITAHRVTKPPLLFVCRRLSMRPLHQFNWISSFQYACVCPAIYIAPREKLSQALNNVMKCSRWADKTQLEKTFTNVPSWHSR